MLSVYPKSVDLLISSVNIMHYQYFNLILRVKVTLIDTEGHRWRSRVIKRTNGHISKTIIPKDIIHGSKVQYYKWQLMKFGQVHTSKSKVTDVEVIAFCECYFFFTSSPRNIFVGVLYFHYKFCLKSMSRHYLGSKLKTTIFLFIVIWNNHLTIVEEYNF